MTLPLGVSGSKPTPRKILIMDECLNLFLTILSKYLTDSCGLKIISYPESATNNMGNQSSY